MSQNHPNHPKAAWHHSTLGWKTAAVPKVLIFSPNKKHFYSKGLFADTWQEQLKPQSNQCGECLIKDIIFNYTMHTNYLHSYLTTFTNIVHMCSPVLISCLWCIPVGLQVDILQTVAELNRVFHCIAANSDYFEVSAVSIVMILWTKGGALS